MLRCWYFPEEVSPLSTYSFADPGLDSHKSPSRVREPALDRLPLSPAFNFFRRFRLFEADRIAMILNVLLGIFYVLDTPRL